MAGGAQLRQRPPSKSSSKAGSKVDYLRLFEPTCYQIMKNDNPYILTGYREETKNSYYACLCTLFTLHNDTMNIWTHIIGGAFMIYLIFDAFFYEPMKNLVLEDRVAFALFLGLTAVCFFVSSAYHLFRTHSVRAYILFLTCDIMGITFQIFSSTVLLIYFELWCFPFWQRTYLAVALLLAFANAFYIPYLVKWRRTSMRTFLLTCFAMMGFVAWFHHLVLAGNLNQFNQHTFTHLVGTYLWVGFGLVIRRIQVPEILKPGWFDIWASSHQLFHTCTVFGSYTLYIGYRKLFEMTAVHECQEGVYF